VTVSIVGSIGTAAFNPNPVSANSGDAVNFKNSDAITHHIVLDDGSADLGEVNSGATSKSLTLKSVAPIGFHCIIHPSAVGSINGMTAPPPPPPDDGYRY